MRKSLSLSSDLLDFAQKKARQYFNNNLSSYVAFLIAKDKEKDILRHNKNS